MRRGFGTFGGSRASAFMSRKQIRDTEPGKSLLFSGVLDARGPILIFDSSI